MNVKWESDNLLFLKKGDHLFTIAIFRYPLAPASIADLLQSLLPSLSATIYQRRAPLESAPHQTDCLTSIHYIFLEALHVNIPMTLIGDMPRELTHSGWQFHLIRKEELQPGDLIFLKKRTEPRLIDHVAVALAVDRVFHCKKGEGALCQSLDDLFEVYEQKILEKQLDYIDSRNQALRKIHGGCYMSHLSP